MPLPSTVALLLCLAGPQTVPQVEIDAPYVETPPAVVEAMLWLAGAGRQDVVYDLGSGDGRIVIAAARVYGARAVGVERNAELVKRARRRAVEAGVAGRVSFRQGDLFDADLREATVVTLYLLADINRRLRPKLLRELPPGARVVSNSFDMGDWKPARQITVNGTTLYLWVIPKP